MLYIVGIVCWTCLILVVVLVGMVFDVALVLSGLGFVWILSLVFGC